MLAMLMDDIDAMSHSNDRDSAKHADRYAVSIVARASDAKVLQISHSFDVGIARRARSNRASFTAGAQSHHELPGHSFGLLLQAGADPDASDAYGATALHHAVWEGPHIVSITTTALRDSLMLSRLVYNSPSQAATRCARL